jgi:hypothetical protein
VSRLDHRPRRIISRFARLQTNLLLAATQPPPRSWRQREKAIIIRPPLSSKVSYRTSPAGSGGGPPRLVRQDPRRVTPRGAWGNCSRAPRRTKVTLRARGWKDPCRPVGPPLLSRWWDWDVHDEEMKLYEWWRNKEDGVSWGVCRFYFIFTCSFYFSSFSLFLFFFRPWFPQKQRDWIQEDDTLTKLRFFFIIISALRLFLPCCITLPFPRHSLG